MEGNSEEPIYSVAATVTVVWKSMYAWVLNIPVYALSFLAFPNYGLVIIYADLKSKYSLKLFLFVHHILRKKHLFSD